MPGEYFPDKYAGAAVQITIVRCYNYAIKNSDHSWI